MSATKIAITAAALREMLADAERAHDWAEKAFQTNDPTATAHAAFYTATLLRRLQEVAA